MCDQQRLRPACAYAQSDQSLCQSLNYSMTERHLEFLSLKGDCTGSSESTHVKTSRCWKSHVMAQIGFLPILTYLVPLLAFRNWTTSPEQWSNPVPVPCIPYQGALSQLFWVPDLDPHSSESHDRILARSPSRQIATLTPGFSAACVSFSVLASGCPASAAVPSRRLVSACLASLLNEQFWYQHFIGIASEY